jgi:sugar phosphate isomerase/epimerase
MRFGIESLPFHDFSLGVTAQAIADLGFRWVNLWASASPLAHHVDVAADDPEAVLARLDRHGLRASGVTMYGRSQEEIAEGVCFASAIGAGRVIFDCEANFPDFVGKFLPPLLEVAECEGVDICVENHLTVPFTSDFEEGGHEDERWDEGVDTFAQIKRLVTELDHPNLKVCIAPCHLWVMGESVIEVTTWLLERKKLGYYYIWDISRGYCRGEDGLNFGPGEEQLPRVGGVLDHGLVLRALAQFGYAGIASLKCHGTAGWPFERVVTLLEQSRDHLLHSAGSSAFEGPDDTSD